MREIVNFLPSKYRTARPENTRWLKYAIEKGIINPIPATGCVLRRDGKPCKEYINAFGYHYISVKMHGTTFSFYVHKCIYLKEHGTIPKGKELDHDDRDLSNNRISNIVPRTTRQNLKRRIHSSLKKEEAF